MKVIQIHATEQGISLAPSNAPQPLPADGELLIRVCAAGVTPTELLWYPTTHTKEGGVRTDAVPGHEFSGTIAALGGGVTGFTVGDDVYGMNDWFASGATAEYCIARPEHIAGKPSILSHEAAATVPISSLTAWQGLISRANIQPGERILVHGGAGAVGLFAVQIAKLHGARVITTVSERNVDFVKGLGADQVIDYKNSRFEDEVDPVDVVFDAVGGDTLNRSWGVLNPKGRLITIAADSEGTADQRVKDSFFIVEPNHEQLVEIAEQLNAGRLKAFVGAAVSFEEAPAAYAGTVKGELGHGKVVVKIAED